MIVKKSKATTKTKKPVVKAHRGMAHIPRGSRQLENPVRVMTPRDRQNQVILNRNKDKIRAYQKDMQSRFKQDLKNMGIDPSNQKQMQSLSPQQRARLNAMSNRYSRQQNKFVFDLGVRNRQQPRRRLTPQQQQQLQKRQQIAMMKAQLKQQKNISPQRRAEMEAFIKASTPTRAPDQRARFTDRAKLARDRFNKQARGTLAAEQKATRMPNTPSSKPTGINRKKAIQDAQQQYRDMLKKQMEQRNKRQKQNEQRVKATKMPTTPATQKTVPTRTPRKPQVDPKARTPQKKRPTGTPRVSQAQPTPRAPTPRKRNFRFRGRRT